MGACFLRCYFRGFTLKYGPDGEIRTPDNGFGDRCVTTTLHPKKPSNPKPFGKRLLDRIDRHPCGRCTPYLSHGQTVGFEPTTGNWLGSPTLPLRHIYCFCKSLSKHFLAHDSQGHLLQLYFTTYCHCFPNCSYCNQLIAGGSYLLFYLLF